MIKVSLFVEEKCRSHMKRLIVPRIGEIIVLDCGDMVRVVEVNHDWDDPTRVQINCVEVKIERDDD